MPIVQMILTSKRQMKSIYCKGNILGRKVGKCSEEVKLQLFQFYCTNMYCAKLWSNHKVSSFKDVRVFYNNNFRYLLSIKTLYGISQVCINYHFDSVAMLYRNNVQRLYKSTNSLVHTIVTSVYFICKLKAKCSVENTSIQLF